MGKDDDGLAGVDNFKPGHACSVVLALPDMLVTGGKKLHIYNKVSHEHEFHIVTGNEVTALAYDAPRNTMYVGLSSGEVKLCTLMAGSTADTVHVWISASDGSISVWDNLNMLACREKPKKVKHHQAAMFPEKKMCVSVGGAETKLFRDNDFDEDRAHTLVNTSGKQAVCVTGFAHDDGIRVFVGHEDGSIHVYDLGNEASESVITTPSLELVKLHTKSLTCMSMHGKYLCASGADKMVSLWNGKETASECNLLRKLKHKGVVSSLSNDKTPDTDAMWCYDETNKKVYNINLRTHIPAMGRGGHMPQMTLDVDPGLVGLQSPSPFEDEPTSPKCSSPKWSASRNPSLASSPPGDASPRSRLRGLPKNDSRLSVSRARRGSDCGSVDSGGSRCSYSSPRTSSFRATSGQTPGLHFQDFSTGHGGSIDALFEAADDWIIANKRRDITIVSVAVVPVFGLSSSGGIVDPLYLEASYACPTTPPVHKSKPPTARVMQIVRVTYRIPEEYGPTVGIVRNKSKTRFQAL